MLSPYYYIDTVSNYTDDYAGPDARFNLQWYNIEDKNPLADVGHKILEYMKLHQDMSDVVGFEIWSRKESATYKDTGFASSYSEYPFNAEWHEDVDEDLRHQEGKLRHPLISSIYYLDVDISEGGKLIFPEHGLEVKPKTNRLALFDPHMVHGVEPFKGTRVALAVNPWTEPIPIRWNYLKKA